MLQPLLQPVQTVGDLFTNQTRLVKRKSRLSSAPTGQMSTVLPEYFESSGCPGKVAMREGSPRLTTASCGSCPPPPRNAPPRAEPLALGLVQLVGADPRRLVVVLHVVILELALAGLIADGAIDGVIDEVELHAAALVLLHRGALSVDLHPLLHPDLAAGHQAAGRVAGLDQAHAALAGDRQPGVVAEIGDGDADAARRLDEVVARVRLDRDAVHLDLDDLAHYCSTSPPIMLIESKIGIRSAMAWPLMSRGSALRMGKPGPRTCTAYGLPAPLETRWKPSSPL